MRNTTLLLLCGGLFLSLGAPTHAQKSSTPAVYTQADVRTLDQQLARFPSKATASMLCNNENVSELKALLVKASSLAWQRSRDPEASTKRGQLEKLLKEHPLTSAQATKLAEAAIAYRNVRGTGSAARKKSTAEKAGEAAGEAVEAAVETAKAGATAAQELATAAAQVAFDFVKGFVKEVSR